MVLPFVFLISQGQNLPLKDDRFFMENPLLNNPAQALPFNEEWTSGTFTYNQWEFDPGLGNWQISQVKKSVDPAADFSWDPPRTNYSYFLVSRTLDATPWNCADIWFDFDYQLVDRNATGNEKFIVELFHDNTWDTLQVLTNNGSVGWTSRHLAIDQVLQKEFRIGFRAAGSHSDDIFHWYIDNIHVYGTCRPPVNLSAILNYTGVTLSWVAPCTTTQLVKLSQWAGTPDNGYYQEFNNAYGVVYDLTGYPVVLLNKIDFHHASWGVTGTWKYKIHVVNWTTFNELAAIGPVYTTGNDTWEVNVPLGDIPDAGGNLIGIMLEPLSNLPANAYPVFSADGTGPGGVSLFGALPGYPGFGTSTIGDFLQNLWIKIPLDDDAEPLQPAENDLKNNLTGHAFLPDESDSGFLAGYNVYRTELNGTGFALQTPAPINVTQYNDQVQFPVFGYYKYFVTAVFVNQGNNLVLCEPSSDTIMVLPIGIDDRKSFSPFVSPNPAGEVVNISAPFIIRSLVVTNIIGRRILTMEAPDDTFVRVNVSGWAPGIYFIRVTDEIHSSTCKLLVRR